MPSSTLEKIATIAVFVFAASVLVATPWPDVDELLGIDPAISNRYKACLSLPKPHPDCPAIHGTRPQP